MTLGPGELLVILGALIIAASIAAEVYRRRCRRRRS